MATDVLRLVALFDQLFRDSEKTRLLSGGDEPVYRPATNDRVCAELVFTQDYFASALHEVAHWCLAGLERRKLEDYGYWYIANRNLQQQAEFERSEVKPQALERVFSECAGYPFKPSLDCLQQPEYRAPDFIRSVNAQYTHYLKAGVPARAQLFADALAREFGGANRKHTSALAVHG